jgi:glycosyltransferase involved in cell wall biosynthesis
MKKKKLLYQSDFSLAKTGFGRAAKALLSYLYNTGKYDIVHYSCGLPYHHPEFERTPWKSVGSLPNSQQELQELNKDPNVARLASYGAHYLDKVMQEEKPDIYIAVQDIWGIDFSVDKKWFNKIPSVLWTTLDSLPILPSALTKADKIKNYWIWSNFATKAMHDLGHKHVKTVHGPIETKNFYRLENHKKEELRKKNNIPLDAFIVGFVFRNQLRKSVPNLLEGYALWKQQNPKIKNTYLLLHTHWGEGWNIHRLAQEYGIDLKEILTTYICRSCGDYEIKPFHGQEVNCRFCGSEKSQITTNVGLGITEEQLNEVYNLMDVYCHPFTSGGQEIPIQEAKLTELITLVTDYSCGQEMCEDDAQSLPLDWTEYREHGTEFKKASTKPSSIAKQIHKVYNMPSLKKKEMGKKAREWTIEHFSVETVGKFIEDFIDSSPETDYDFSAKEEQRDPYFQIPEIKDDAEWLTCMYNNILKMRHVDHNDDGHKYWIEQIVKGAKRNDIENYFRKIATQENEKNKKISFEEILGPEKPEDRVLYVMPESIGDIYISTSLFSSIKKQYPNKKLYVATNPQYFSILEGNPFVDKVIQYIPQMDQLLWLEGIGDHKGYFQIAFLPHIGTQRIFNYHHNGKTKIAFDLKDEQL